MSCPMARYGRAHDSRHTELVSWDELAMTWTIMVHMHLQTSGSGPCFAMYTSLRWFDNVLPPNQHTSSRHTSFTI